MSGMLLPRTKNYASHLDNAMKNLFTLLNRYKSETLLVFALVLPLILISMWQSRAELEICDGAGVNRQKCFALEIDRTLSTEGLDKAFDALIVFSKKDANFATACHGNVHEIGKAMYNRFFLGEKIKYTPKMSYCGYGFFHGFMEELLADTGNIEKAVIFCKSLDAELSGSVSGGTQACFHGIGHGAVDASEPSAWGNPTLMIYPAMELCKRLPKENYAEHLCQTGAYNSLEILSTDSKYKLESLTRDPYSFCNSEPRERREGCYTNMIPAVLRITKDDVGKSGRYILKNIIYPDDLTIDDFYVDEMVILSLFQEFDRLHLGEPEMIEGGIELCRQFSSGRVRLACFMGISGGFMKYSAPKSAYENWRLFCDNSALREDERNSCYKYVLSRISLWYDEMRAKKICKSVPAQYQGFCKIKR